MNESQSTATSKAAQRPLRRAAVLLALLLGTALVAGPVTAEAAPRTTVAAAAHQAGAVRDAARPLQAAGHTDRHTVAEKSSVTASKKVKKKSSFLKKLGIFLLVLVLLFIAFVVFVIWFIVSRLRRRRNRH
ncbi:hypothetical protein [Streptomyces sp. NPDC050485]|uniref:hypothetical protein n=1 Tax=Streptomyces sp. NPDC050485 TaxID=3365617 RepID=UPI0037A02639